MSSVMMNHVMAPDAASGQSLRVFSETGNVRIPQTGVDIANGTDGGVTTNAISAS